MVLFKCKVGCVNGLFFYVVEYWMLDMSKKVVYSYNGFFSLINLFFFYVYYFWGFFI